MATYADRLALPEDARAEILNGEIVVAPSPTPAHQSTIAEIYADDEHRREVRATPERTWEAVVQLVRDRHGVIVRHMLRRNSQVGRARRLRSVTRAALLQTGAAGGASERGAAGSES